MLEYVKKTEEIALIKAPYRCFTGVVLNERQVKELNNLTIKINYEIVNYGVVLEARLNERHRIFLDMARGVR